MTAAIDITEEAAMTALRSFIALVLAPAVEVIRGQDNRVGEPAADDYVVLTPMGRVRLSTNVVSYDDPAANPPGSGEAAGAGGIGTPAPGTRRICQATELTIQADVHGPGASDNAQRLSTVLRDGYAAEMFRAASPGVQPLYVGDPRQMPFINGEDQYEDRWTLDVAVQVNVTVTVPQDFAGTVTVLPLPADPGESEALRPHPPGGP